ncbi:hypothetical protein BDQ17DRAFT_1249109, partial [Cyathus striatus]
FPLFLSQIDRERPSMVFKESSAEFLSSAGTISPSIKKGQISTIAQFRVLDYGMELCELRFQLNETLPSTSLSVYRMMAAKALDGTQLNYRNSPRKAELLGHLESDSYDGKINWAHKMPCMMDDILTFHVSCSNKHPYRQCDLTWLQHHNGELGKYFISIRKTVNDVYCLEGCI